MSKQFNYFAMERDERIVCEAVLAAFEDAFLLPERGIGKQMVPRRILNPEELSSQNIGDMAVLVLPEFASSVQPEEISENKYYINLRVAPVLEYSPSRTLEPGVVKAGRFAYFYKGEPLMEAKVTKLFRALKQQAKRVPGSSVFWIFEQASQEARELHQGVGNLRPNPFSIEKQV